MVNQAQTSLVTDILKRAAKGADLSVEEGIHLIQEQDSKVRSLIAQTADRLRNKQVGDTVTYVINRNINFTNIC